MQPICFLLSDMGLLCVRGQKAQALLQGQLTCDLTEITPTETRLGAHCNPQGRVISLFRVFYFNDDYYLIMPKALLPIAKQALQKYAVFFQVTLHDASDELHCFGYCSDEMPVTLAVNQACPYDDGLFIRIPSTESPRYLFISPTWMDGKQNAALDWHRLELSAGMPAIYPETSEIFLPHELNLPALAAVSFQKGCYTGQEIIARMHYRGKLKTELCGATVTADSPPTRGAAIYPSGYIVDVAPLTHKQYQLLIIAQLADINNHSLFLDAAQQHNIRLSAERHLV